MLKQVAVHTQYYFLKTVCKQQLVSGPEDCVSALPKIHTHLGDKFIQQLKGKRVIDFGCGLGDEVLEMARAGAGFVHGLEIGESQLRSAQRRIQESGLTARCCASAEPPDWKADLITSIDAFEHFEDPTSILEQMHRLLMPGGMVYASFGPIWFHPRGGHAFSPLPWAHLVLNEEALCRWRNLYFPGTATSFETTGLNKMTVRRFRQYAARSAFHIESLATVPIHALRWLHVKWTEEFTTSVVRVVLRKAS